MRARASSSVSVCVSVCVCVWMMVVVVEAVVAMAVRHFQILRIKNKNNHTQKSPSSLLLSLWLSSAVNTIVSPREKGMVRYFRHVPVDCSVTSARVNKYSPALSTQRESRPQRTMQV